VELSELVYQQKLSLNFVQEYKDEEISYPSVSIHPSEVNSNEATETFSEMMDFAGSNIEDLTDA